MNPPMYEQRGENLEAPVQEEGYQETKLRLCAKLDSVMELESSGRNINFLVMAISFLCLGIPNTDIQWISAAAFTWNTLAAVQRQFHIYKLDALYTVAKKMNGESIHKLALQHEAKLDASLKLE
jgi:hypothetical protein